MEKPAKRDILCVQLMLGISLIFGVFPPLAMYLVTKRKNRYFQEASSKALNFHLTIFPLFVVSYFLPPWFMLIILGIETCIIVNVIIRIALQKSYRYPAIPYVRFS